MQEEKGTTEDEMVGWHHQLSGHEFEQALGYGEGRGSFVCSGSWGHKESDTTERLNRGRQSSALFQAPGKTQIPKGGEKNYIY